MCKSRLLPQTARSFSFFFFLVYIAHSASLVLEAIQGGSQSGQNAGHTSFCLPTSCQKLWAETLEVMVFCIDVSFCYFHSLGTMVYNAWDYLNKTHLYSTSSFGSIDIYQPTTFFVTGMLLPLGTRSVVTTSPKTVSDTWKKHSNIPFASDLFDGQNPIKTSQPPCWWTTWLPQRLEVNGVKTNFVFGGWVWKDLQADRGFLQKSTEGAQWLWRWLLEWLRSWWCALLRPIISGVFPRLDGVNELPGGHPRGLAQSTWAGSHSGHVHHEYRSAKQRHLTCTL